MREEHDAILAAIRAPRFQRATALMRSHIERSHANVRELIGRALERAYLDSPKEFR